MVVVLLAEVA